MKKILISLSLITLSFIGFSQGRDANYSFTTSHIVVKKKFMPMDIVAIYDGTFTITKSGINLTILGPKGSAFNRTVAFRELNSIGFVYSTMQGYITIDTAKKEVTIHGKQLDSIYQGGH